MLGKRPLCLHALTTCQSLIKTVTLFFSRLLMRLLEAFDDGYHKMNISKFSRFCHGKSYLSHLTSRKICISRYSSNLSALQPTTQKVILRKYQSNSGPPAEIYRGMAVVASKFDVADFSGVSHFLSFVIVHIRNLHII